MFQRKSYGVTYVGHQYITKTSWAVLGSAFARAHCCSQGMPSTFSVMPRVASFSLYRSPKFRSNRSPAVYVKFNVNPPLPYPAIVRSCRAFVRLNEKCGNVPSWPHIVAGMTPIDWEPSPLTTVFTMSSYGIAYASAWRTDAMFVGDLTELKNAYIER